MLIQLKSRIQEPEVQELLSYSVFPDPDHLNRALQQYVDKEELHLDGYEDEGQLIGLIGYESTGTSEITIHHIAVLPENRFKNYGRGMISQVLAKYNPDRLIAETDVEAVEFYRNTGFVVYSLGELYPGVERFRCVLEKEEEQDED
ncbi:GNAT family N-acetyltransferase [Paenibacillus taichungensis]|uniref:GNAT family N-acetyltransferase n=1 Tax=Paenibacillus TaxID=44249 RepID=UPI000C194B6E|nr:MULTISPECIES: GNAT family N-acetyltransferase [Paenibacillus]MEC0110494.1 GNAT family N-acetyltransferase [Paenibacillus taichungensis]MEC0197790.1 GNAT family N-acetyltransferase [Paenibacillus taichungensis]PIH61331.1 GNAT family N-acetyltransferase [Paenibacillus sp. LK1]